MKKIVLRLLPALRTFLYKAGPLLILVGLSLCSEPEQPRPEITAIAPGQAPVGESVAIKGKNLAGVKTLKFGNVASYIGSKSDAEIVTVVPPGLAPGDILVSVTSDGGASNGYKFTVLPSEPEITSIEPDRGSVGMEIIIKGKYFSNASGVSFGDQTVSTFLLNSDTELKLNVPVNLDPGALNLKVTTAGGTSENKTFTIVGKPVISLLSPSTGPVGKIVSITGEYLEDASKVFFGTAEAVFEINSATLIEATVPPAATTGKVKVITPGGEAISASEFIIKDVPVLSSFSPISGIVGTVVTINGTGFDGGTVTVKFGTVKATEVSVISPTQITAKVPSLSTTGKITVETSAGAAISSDTFTVIGAPVITAFAPGSGQAGVEVTITGNNFINVSGAKFNGTNVPASDYTVISATQVKAKVPAGASTGKITVSTLAGTATAATDFTILVAPVITSFSPAFGSPGSAVAITGTGFSGTTSVKFNGTDVGASNFTVISATQITAKVPGGATSGKIAVTNPQGTANSPNNFYVTPFITTVTPSSAGIGGIVTLNGTNLESAAVKFNSTSVTPISNTATTITVAVPTGISGAINITVTNAGGTSNGKSFTITSSVVVDEIVATQNITDQLLLLRGTNLLGATKVMFGSTAASVFTNTSKVVTTKIPVSLAPGSYAVTVVTPNGTSNGNPFEVLSTQNPNTGDVNMVNGASVTGLPPGYVPPVSNQWYNTFDPDQRFLISESDNSIEFSINFVTQATGTIIFDTANNYVEFTLAGIRYVGVWSPRSTEDDGFGGTNCFAHMTVISSQSGKQLELAVQYFDNCP